MPERVRTICRQMRELIVTLNLFETVNTSTDPHELSTGRMTTRVYLIFLTFSMYILVLYTSIGLRVESITVKNPSEANFNVLYNKYHSTLHCPCSEITTPYGSFISISPVFHPVCRSWLVSNEWIEYLTSIRGRLNHYEPDDFRSNARSVFNALATLCDLANVTIINAWRVVSRSVLYTDEVLPMNYFSLLARATFDLFQTSTTAELKRSFAVINLQTQSIFVPEEGSIR
jgi:hypothetical protein